MDSTTVGLYLFALLVTFVIGSVMGLLVQIGNRRRFVVLLSIVFFHGAILGWVSGVFVDLVCNMRVSRLIAKLVSYLGKNWGEK